MKLTKENFGIRNLHTHLQYAVDLELWTIPFYMSAMYSIKDKNSNAYQLIRSVLNQEMLHLQSAANIANAYGLSPEINVPVYQGQKVPHLDFNLDPAQIVHEYEPYTAEIGALDLSHINAMCLIELPDFEADKQSASDHIQLFDKPEEYGTIGAFYKALLHMAEQHQDKIIGGVKQIDFFAPFYRNAPSLIVTDSGQAGFSQVELLINLITDQGEGFSLEKECVPCVFQNTADDPAPAEDHFEKFNKIKHNPLPEVFDTKSEYNPEDRALQLIVAEQFKDLTKLLQALFNGENPGHFFPIMASVGASIRNCWQNGVVPDFGHPVTKEGE